MFTPYTALDKCVGRELQVRIAGEDYKGMLAGVYLLHGQPMLVLTPMHEEGTERHIPLQNAVVTLRPGR